MDCGMEESWYSSQHGYQRGTVPHHAHSDTMFSKTRTLGNRYVRPSTNTTVDEQQEYLEDLDLEHLIDQVKPRHILLLGGDFNAEV